MDAHNLSGRIQYGHECTRAVWREDANAYDITFRLADNQQLVVQHRYLTLCWGPFSGPNMPKIPGLSAYQGQVFHSMDWPENLKLEDLKGKSVMVVGNGSSG